MPADGASCRCDLVDEFLHRKFRFHAGDGRELVHRPSCKTKAFPAQFRHTGTTCRRQRDHNEGRLVADPARAVLVNGKEVFWETNDLPRMCHRPGEGFEFLGRKPPEEDGHQPGRDLIIRNSAVLACFHQSFHGFGRHFEAFPFGFQEGKHLKHENPRPPGGSREAGGRAALTSYAWHRGPLRDSMAFRSSRPHNSLHRKKRIPAFPCAWQQ